MLDFCSSCYHRCTEASYKKEMIYVGICILQQRESRQDMIQFSGHALSDALQQIVQKETYDLEEIKAESDGVCLKYRGNFLKLIPEENEMGQTLTAQINKKEKQTAFWDGESQSFIFNDKSFGSLKFDTYREKGTQYLIIYDGDMTWNFYKEDGSSQICLCESVWQTG